MKELSVSVIIPTFNSSKTIIRALDSVLRQTCLPEEIIIIDDASTDETIITVKRFIDENKQLKTNLLVNENNCGPSVTRNKGITASNQSWVAFLDADDFWHPQKLQIQLELSQKYQCNFIGTYFGIQSSFNSIIQKENIQIKTLNRFSFLWKNHFSTPSVLIKNSPLLQFDSDMHYAEDFNLWSKMIKHYGTALLIQEKLVSLGGLPYRAGGLSSKLIKMELGELKVLQKETNLFLRYLAMIYSLVKFSKRLVFKFITT